MLKLRDIPNIKRQPRPEPRLGFFYVSDIIVDEHWDQLLILMPHIVPLEVVYRAERRAYRYLCHSELFEPSDRGVVPPEYEVVLSRVPGEGEAPDTYTFEFKRVSAGSAERLY